MVFKKTGDIQANFHARMGMIKDRNGKDPREAEDTKKGQEYTRELRKLYAGQQATVRNGHGTTDWFQIENGVCLCMYIIADDTTLMAESEEELKSFSTKVKEESEKVG